MSRAIQTRKNIQNNNSNINKRTPPPPPSPPQPAQHPCLTTALTKHQRLVVRKPSRGTLLVVDGVGLLRWGQRDRRSRGGRVRIQPRIGGVHRRDPKVRGNIDREAGKGGPEGCPFGDRFLVRLSEMAKILCKTTPKQERTWYE